MPDSNRHYYAIPSKLTIPTDLESLESLDKAVKRAKKNLDRFTELSQMGTLRLTKQGYTVEYIREGLEQWQRAYESMVKCWNSFLEEMKIK